MELSPFLQIGAIGLLGASSPGPDFIMVAKSSLTHGRRCGIASAHGLGLGILIHSAYCILGVALLLATSPHAQRVIQYGGAAYLFYLGLRSLIPGGSVPWVAGRLPCQKPRVHRAFLTGLFSNLLNPKVTLFILSVFSQLVQPGSARSIQALFALELAVVTVAWFSLLACGISYAPLRERLLRSQGKIERAFGIVLIGVGIAVSVR